MTTTNIDRSGRRPLVTFREASAVLSLSPVTLRRLIARGDGPPLVRLSPRRIAFDPLDLERWLASRRVETPRRP